MYPLSDFLNPQGDGCSRGLLEFAKGKAITTKKGKDYFLRYGASLYGHDKKSDKDKDEWASEQHNLFIFIAGLPLEYHHHWSEADKPWQFLAWCFEYSKWVQDKSVKVHLPIMVDGTCNGLQHLSAIMKDKEGGRAVNLIGEGDTPNDIYQMVADKANDLLPNSPIVIDRKLCKRPVMTTPYGATIYGMREQIKDELKRRNTNKIGTEMEWDNFDNIVLVSDTIYQAIGEIIVKSREFMDWLQEIAQTVGGSNFPMEWMTPFGFYVYQTYYKSKQKRIQTHLSGKLKSYRASVREIIPYYQDIYKIKNSIAPNFIHSMDAAHLMFVVNDLAYEHKIKEICVVHDCYGVHADMVDTLVSTLKDTFIEMYTGDGVVNSFIEDFLKKYLDKVDYFKIVEERPETGTLDINDVKNSRFFFS